MTKTANRLRQITGNIAAACLLLALAALVFESLINEALPFYVGF